ncbi:hypothetical protein DV515_00007710 [Chloebia gouldiae]|uniref:Uncharacterized protein n=1 Tax=Chloebia gouldiae TaxID=44316 RepID=A0A3L8SHU6_CHLGU|nr:hypothetical protein DV515_00007710 [Chloebia gouldiae]
MMAIRSPHSGLLGATLRSMSLLHASLFHQVLFSEPSDVREGRECLSLMDVTAPDTRTYG